MVSLIDGVDVFLEDDLLSGMRQDDFREPTLMSLGPERFAGVADVLAKQESGQLLAGAAVGSDGVFSGAG